MNSTGLSEDGPSDKRLVIHLSGATPPSWVKIASYGYVIDLEELGVLEPSLFKWKWISVSRLARVKVTKTDRGLTFDAQL